ncbi:hypothetical protein VY88_03205 [Azospirillum thiophilum]|uniref:Uncharacterized protein n=1 Tax=Azospirillum thiophilum TaxID=528244 RepID=A0AAC9EXC1_9PROT|nr:hypothetical protein [Azospirillum thiophilum]ALG71111.1 hypothetical protein AL072_09500 [Azospirillum thiophilum]KJR65230.1 hypothetical protein VY88_03205 [Azospirillum thiophilum]
MPKPAPLLPVFLAYQQLAGCAECEPADRLRGGLEQLLSAGEVVSADDLFAKARYLQDCGRIDPGLIPMEALDTLVAGVALLLGPGLSQQAAA